MNIYKDFPLAQILYYKIGGKAKFVLSIENKEDLIESIDFIEKNNIKKILTIGLGSNLLISDKPFDGAVLWFCKAESSSILASSIVVRKDNLIEAFSSVILDDLIQFSFKNNLVGLEWAGGLPSSIGGAIRGNVGAFGGEIKDSVQKIEIIDLASSDLSIKELDAADLQFSYRDSLIKKNKNLIVVKGFFQLTVADEQKVEEAKRIYHVRIEYRQKNHPLEYPSCGSVFKNITGSSEINKITEKWPDVYSLSQAKWHNKIAMGYVINRLGFSGLQIGGAQVSEKHANYIVNVNKAKFTDIISIIDKIKEKFSNTFGFLPELELEIVENN